MAPLLELRSVCKRFGGVRAVVDGDLELAAGEVHGLVGENGAGKSTLSKIIAGVHQPDTGDVLVDGEPVRFHSPRDALAAGIATIAQEIALVPRGTVEQNVLLGIEPNQGGVVRRRGLRRRFEELEARVSFGLRPDARVGALRTAEQQKVEIMRAIARDARLIVMDEPTAALTRDESERLLDIIRRLADGGTSVLLVSHHLDEVLEVCSVVTVMRDGHIVRTGAAKDETPGTLGIAMLPESRKEQGLVMMRSVRENVTLPTLDDYARAGVVSPRRERARVGELSRDLGIRAPSLDAPVTTLSGGNQQKVLFGKWLARPPRVLIADEPTRGVDVGAKRQIHELIIDLAERGMAVLLISSELEEVLGLAHSVVVMRRGRVVARYEGQEATMQSVMSAAFAAERHEEAA